MMNRTQHSLLLFAALFSLVFASACATSDGAGSRKNRELTALEELPEQYASAWKAWREDTPQWREWRSKVKADPKLANFFVDNLVRVMIKSYDSYGLRPLGDSADAFERASRDFAGPFERASRELVYLGDYSAPVMIELIPLGDTIVSYLAGDILIQIGEGRWCLPLAKKLQGGQPEDRRRAAEWLAKLPSAGADEEEVQAMLEATLEDPDWTVRVQGVDTIGLRGRARGRVDLARPALCRALGDSNPDVVKVACAALSKNEDTDSVPALINLMERGERAQDFHIIQAAQLALQGITKERQALGSLAWRKWWGDWWKTNRS